MFGMYEIGMILLYLTVVSNFIGLIIIVLLAVHLHNSQSLKKNMNEIKEYMKKNLK